MKRRGNWSGTQTISTSRAGNILNLCVEEAPPQPYLVQVTLYWPIPAAMTGELRVFADLDWRVGNAGAKARIDVPAGGTTVTVAGADSLSVDVGAEGASTDSVRVVAQAAVVGTSHARPAQRTERHDLPGDHATVRDVPEFARGVRAIATLPADLVNVQLDYSARPDVASRHSLSPIHGNGFITRPNGASAYSLNQTGGASNTVYMVWELML